MSKKRNKSDLIYLPHDPKTPYTVEEVFGATFAKQFSKARHLEDIRDRQETIWKMAETFLKQRDAHGIMDMGAELQALERAYKEVEKVQ